MRSFCKFLRYYALMAFVVSAMGITGCGNSCIVGFSNNGNGGVIVKAGDPPPVCTLNPAQGMVRAALVKTAVCEGCAPVAQVRHMYVVLRGIQIHSEGAGSDSGNWVDVAPETSASPRSLDLIGDSRAESPATAAVVPAGTYDLVRLQFAPDEESSKSLCGLGVTNCLIMGDGRLEPLGFPGEAPEVLIRLNQGGTPMLVLPDTTSALQIRLGAQKLVGAFLAGAGKPQTQLVGEASVAHDIPTN
jgi:hypothetical protein